MNRRYIIVRNGHVPIRIGKHPVRWIPFNESELTNHRYAVSFETYGAAIKCCRMNGGCVRAVPTNEVLGPQRPETNHPMLCGCAECL
jgi:hypothetical protein